MFEILVIILFCWLFVKMIGLTFKVAWGAAKLIAVILAIIALPVLIVGFAIAGGVLLLLPVLLIAGSVWVLKKVA